jgi:ethanolamine utilization microcompartment shell protein EutS
VYGDPNPAFTGTITGLKNGDAISATFSAAADATSAVGVYPIVAALSDPRNKLGNYSVIASGTLTITPAPLTTIATDASRLYGDPNPVFAGSLSGLKNGDAITVSFQSTAVAGSPVGTYPIAATLIDPTNKAGNYSITATSGTLTITPAPLSVAANNASRVYGDANLVFTGTLTGVKNADNITATFASIADAASSIGSFPIVPTLVDPAARLGNYSVLSTNGTLTVNPAPLNASATNASRLYGDPNPVFAGTITGIKNADNITAVFASPAVITSPVGTFPIVLTLVDPTSKLGNYTVTSNNGTLTVAPGLR